MGTIIKVISIILAAILVIAFLTTVITVGRQTWKYITKQNFTFGKAVEWSVADYRDWLNSIFSKKGDEIEYYPFTNQKVDVVACTAL